MPGILKTTVGGEVSAMAGTSFPTTSDVSASLADKGGDKQKAQENGRTYEGLVGMVLEKFTRADLARRPFEQRWLEAYRNYRGLYGPDQQFTLSERSRVFIKLTKTKVFAAYGQLIDIFFSNGAFPISVEPEKLPGGVDPEFNIETKQQGEEQALPEEEIDFQLESPYGYEGDGKKLEPGFIATAITKFVGTLRKNEKLQKGPAKSPTAVQINPTEIAAKKIEKQIQDQLKFSEADKHLRHVAFENVLFGTGAIKGPLASQKEIPSWDIETGEYKPEFKLFPKINAVSIWNLYPDPDASSDRNSMQFMIERHKMTRSQLHKLKRMPFFRTNVIDEVIEGGYNWVRPWWEPALQDLPAVAAPERYEVIEYWGMIDKQLAEAEGLEIPKELDELDEIPINIWISGGKILRLVLNPFKPEHIPYYLIPHEIQPYIVWGVGVAENMSDSQQLMNGFMRMAVDNAALSGNCIFEVDETMLIPGQDYTLYPGKFFRTQGANGLQVIRPIKIDNISVANMQMFDKARELADEATFPSYTHGQTGINPSLGRTSSGISMLMGASSVMIRNVVKNFDDYLFVPLGEAMYAFKRQFMPDKETAVNLIIKAGGTDSLMRNEVKSQRLSTVVQLGLNPMLAPFFKWPQLLREVFKSLDMDPDILTNTSSEALRQAAYLQQLAQNMGTNPMQQQPQQAPQGEDSRLSSTAMPGDREFSAAKTPAAPQPAPEGPVNV